MNDNFLYSVERELDLPIDILWAAWTDPVALEAWYHPTDLSVVPGSVTSEAAAGGVWSVAVNVPAVGVVAYFYGRYTAVVENARLEHTMASLRPLVTAGARSAGRRRRADGQDHRPGGLR